MHKLQELVLTAKHKNNFEIESFLKQTSINFNNIIILKCLRFGDNRDIGAGNRFDIDDFRRLLRKFSNIEYLELCNNFLTARIDAEQLKELYPKCKDKRGNSDLKYAN